MASSLEQLMQQARRNASGQGPARPEQEQLLRNYASPTRALSSSSARMQTSTMPDTSYTNTTQYNKAPTAPLYAYSSSQTPPEAPGQGAAHAPLAQLNVPDNTQRGSPKHEKSKPVTPASLRALSSSAQNESRSTASPSAMAQTTQPTGTSMQGAKFAIKTRSGAISGTTETSSRNVGPQPQVDHEECEPTAATWNENYGGSDASTNRSRDGPVYQGIQAPQATKMKKIPYEGMKVPLWSLPSLPSSDSAKSSDTDWPSLPRLHSEPLVSYETERPRKSYRLLAASSCFRCYPVKRNYIRVIDQNTKAKAYLKGHTHDVLDMELCPCGSVSDTLLASIDTRGQACIHGLRASPVSGSNSNVMYNTHLLTLLAPRVTAQARNSNDSTKHHLDCFRVSWAPPSIADSGRVLLLLTAKGLFAVDVNVAEHEEGVGGIIDLAEHREKKCITLLWSPEPDSTVLPSSLYVCPTKYGTKSSLVAIGCSQFSGAETPQHVIVGLLTISPKSEVYIRDESIRRVTLSKSLFSHKGEAMHVSRVEHVMLQPLANDAFVLCIGGYNATMWLNFAGEVNLKQKRPISLNDTATMRLHLPGINEFEENVRYHPILENESGILFLAAEHRPFMIALTIDQKEGAAPVFTYACCFRISEPCVALTLDSTPKRQRDEEILPLYAVLRTSINAIECHYRKCRPAGIYWRVVDYSNASASKSDSASSNRTANASSGGKVGSMKILNSKQPRPEVGDTLNTLPEEPSEEPRKPKGKQAPSTMQSTGDRQKSKSNASAESIQDIESTLVQKTEQAVSSSIKAAFTRSGGPNDQSVMAQLTKDLSSTTSSAVRKALQEETRTSLVPAVEGVTAIKDEQVNEIVEHLNEKLLPQLHQKVMNSLAPITEQLADSLAQQVAAEVSPIVSSTFEQAFSNTLLPGLESATQKMIAEMQAALHAEAQEASRSMHGHLESELAGEVKSLKSTVETLLQQSSSHSGIDNDRASQPERTSSGNANAPTAASRPLVPSTTSSGTSLPLRTQDCTVEISEPTNQEVSRRLKGNMQRSAFNSALYDAAFSEALDKEDETIPLWLCAMFPRQKHLSRQEQDAADIVCEQLGDISLICLLQQVSCGADSIPNDPQSAVLFLLWIVYAAKHLEQKVNRIPSSNSASILADSKHQLEELWSVTGYVEDLQSAVQEGLRALSSVGRG
eukprot:gb/GECG01007840.1/.p1 GENE.gb/GECG01007840.1/~~gb/GECG01007840.1/.p1  ORF type:complete len:1190 (+),score=135.78 gb/GECG01007840.1/:1-3570(+)